MAKTDWQMGDTVLPDDLNQIGQEINQNRDNLAAHTAATTGVHGATSAATPNTLVQRDPAGRFKAGAPSASDDVARKAEVDAHATRTDNPHNTTASQVGALPKKSFSSGIYDFNNRGDGSFIEEIKNNTSITIQNGPSGFASGALIQTEGSHGKWLQQIAIDQQNAKIFFRVGRDTSGVLTWDTWREIWHSGNDGAGSGLDADTVDGYHASQLVRSKNAHQVFMRWEEDHTLHVDVDEVQDLPVAKAKDADLLDGMQPSTSASANTIVQRGADGSTEISRLTLKDYFPVINMIDTDEDYYVRILNENGSLFIQRMRKSDNQWMSDIAIVPLTGKIWTSQNHGAGSGLDADTVRGYIPANKAGDNFTGNINIQKGGDAGIDFGTSPKVAGAIGVFPGWSDRLYINTNSAEGGKSVTRPEGVEIGGPVYVEGGQKVWHAGNLPVETGTWTPELRFGGQNTGIIYLHRHGRYTRIANVVYWNFSILLSSKGSASGVAGIDGLPFHSSTATNSRHAVGLASNISVPSGQWLSSYVLGTTVHLMTTNTGLFISSAEFANNSEITASGFYFI